MIQLIGIKCLLEYFSYDPYLYLMNIVAHFENDFDY